jgi:hypothetical protein
MSDSNDSSRSLSRRDFDEVIRRAAEIAASEPEGRESSLTEGELFRIAREVGLEERHVRKALTEVRTSPPTPGGPLPSLYGPRSVVASRVIPDNREHLVEVLDDFLVAGQLLQNVRKTASVLQYRPAVDWASQIARAASSTSRRYYVASAKRVEVRMDAVDDDHTLVELEVDPGTRGDYVAGGVFGGGVAGGAVGVGLGLSAAALAVPVALAVAVGVGGGSAILGGIAWTTGRAHKKKLLEVRAEMEGILDRLERGESLEPPPASWKRWVRRHFHGVAREILGGEEDESGGP